MRQLFQSVLTTLHAIAIVLALIDKNVSWVTLTLFFVMVPFYGLGVRVAGDWLAARLKPASAE
ncbi:hypothetical protein [Caulobacter vibrioides]|uniref:hypothetical protein n=1 Tax=Caulobacter vibrioides TaxID=155892 RepID=UPI000BB50715|nr:hypothetical protein [Caulobacter vibrioides]ATC23643.1 hypothetical protein CA608_03395 [Caulobacter vibrioides]PLR11761.1 hypothetical protein CVUC_10175 [Caulobacter vibrioides]